ncbi:zinc finger X-chromosomal protein-like [Contarinia nasturtii]|uniref:zinc finger X-chromosomal protein-like n=1 Tax=Contarinia nasturtii TaxID=265458 RepID=UPI0012D3DF8D|nr:zinc finger X-chromosomal protein-like [Contarinia nasturtii]
MRNHMNSPKFKCETCGREFNRKDLLKRHSTIHLDYFPHLCSHCGKKFKQKKNLVNHVRIHTNERPYHCNYCPYTCSDHNILKHIRQKHRLTGSDMKQHYTRKGKLT